MHLVVWSSFHNVQANLNYGMVFTVTALPEPSYGHYLESLSWLGSVGGGEFPAWVDYLIYTMVIFKDPILYLAWKWSTSLWWVCGWWCWLWMFKPILVFSFGIDLAEQYSTMSVTYWFTESPFCAWKLWSLWKSA